MRRYSTTLSGMALVSLVVMSIALSAQAQDVRCRITDLDLRTVRTPQFQDSRFGSSGSRYEWLEAIVEYETDARRGEWTDEITIEWSLLVRPGDRRPLLLKRRVTYVDIEEGDHHAAIYLRPGFVRRYTEQKTPNESDFAVYVEISAGGDRLARAEESKQRQPDNWWRAGEPNVKIVEGELLPRTETPFAHIDYDYFEHIKPEP